MNANALAARGDNASIVEAIITKGDIGKLTPAERNQYYAAVCESIGLNPLTRPFEYLTLNGKMVLYARRDAADQLRKINGISVEIVSRNVEDGLLTVHVRAKDASGRTDEDLGVVAVGNLKGDAAANAMLKAITKAKRRVTLSISGLGFLDETELETIPGATSSPAPRVRDGSDGQPKSSRQAKLSGDWDIAKELEPITSVAALEEWRAQNEDRIAKLPKAWRESLEQEIYDPKLEELKRAADAPAKLNAADSAKVKGILTRSLDMCKDAASVDEWQAKNRDVFRSMTRADQEEVVRERDARLAEMFKPSDDEQPDEDGVFADDEQNILMAG